MDTTFIPENLIYEYNQITKLSSNKKPIIKEFFTLNKDEISKDADISLSNMLDTFIEYSKESPTEIFEDVKEKRKNFKKYLLKLIKQDYLNEAGEQGNPCYLSKECASYEEIIRIGATLGEFKTVESLKESRFNTVKEWASDTTSDCTDFVYFKALKNSRRITAVITDIKYYCLLSMLQTRDDEKKSRLIIETAYEAPIFSTSKSKMDITLAEQDGYVTAFESFKQGYTEVKTTIERQKIEDSTAMAIMDEMRMAYKADMPPAFDMSDFTLLSCVCSAITGENIASGVITLPLKDVYSEYYGETTRFRRQDYKKLLKKIEHLAKYSLELSRFIPETQTFEHKVLHFFDFSYDLPIKGDIIKDIDDINNLDQIPDEDIDFGRCVTRFRLGDSIINAWREQAMMQVSEDVYASLPSAKSKAFLFYLEGKRIKSYPEYETFIPFSDIKNSIRFDKKVRFKTEIRNLLEIFRIDSSDKKYDKAKMIISYELKMNGINIKFKPFTKLELKTYKLNNKKRIESKAETD